MSWIVLVLSGALEAVWAVALSLSRGLSRWRPTTVFVVAMALSMAGLAYAMQEIPTGTAYAVWVGIGAVLTVESEPGAGTAVNLRLPLPAPEATRPLANGDTP